MMKKIGLGALGAAATAFALAPIAGAVTDTGADQGAAFTALLGDVFGTPEVSGTDGGAGTPATPGLLADTFATGDNAVSSDDLTEGWDQFNVNLAHFEESFVLDDDPSSFDLLLVNDFNILVGYLQEGLFDVRSLFGIGDGYADGPFTIDGAGLDGGDIAHGLQVVQFGLDDDGDLTSTFSNINLDDFFGDLFTSGS